MAVDLDPPSRDPKVRLDTFHLNPNAAIFVGEKRRTEPMVPPSFS